MNVPQHIAIILDGNGRWAKAKGMPRNYTIDVHLLILLFF